MGADQDCRLPRVSLYGTSFPNHDCSSRRSPGASHWRAHVQNKASRSQQEPPDNCSHPRSPKFGPREGPRPCAQCHTYSLQSQVVLPSRQGPSPMPMPNRCHDYPRGFISGIKQGRARQ